MPTTASNGGNRPKASGPKSAAQPASALLAGLSPRVRIGGAIALAVIVIGGLVFLFAVGPEESGRAAADIAAENARAAAASSAASGAAAVQGNPAASQGGGAYSSASGGGPAGSQSAAPSGAYASGGSAPPDGYAASGATGAGSYADSTAANNRSALPRDPNSPVQPGEVEGSPPVNGDAGAGSTWHPGDKEGAVISHGPASDP